MKKAIHFKCLIFSVLTTQIHAQVFQNSPMLPAWQALGNATVAQPNAENGFSNESALALTEKTQATAGVSLPFGISDWRAMRAQVALPVRNAGAFGFDLVQSGISVFREQKFGLAYGRKVAAKAWAGAGFEYLRVSADEYGAAGTLTFSLGFLAETLPGFFVGGHVHNPFAQKIGDVALASNYRFGFSWKASPVILLLGEVEKSAAQPALKAGFQYKLHPKIMARLGVRTNPARVGFGAGVELKSNLRADFSAEWHPILGITPAAGLVWQRPAKGFKVKL